jgi:hypothetical protein
MTARIDAVEEIENIIGIMLKQLENKKAFENAEQEKDLKNRIAHLHNKTVIIHNTKIKKFEYDFNDLKKDLEAMDKGGIKTETVEPKPIV